MLSKCQKIMFCFSSSKPMVFAGETPLQTTPCHWRAGRSTTCCGPERKTIHVEAQRSTAQHMGCIARLKKDRPVNDQHGADRALVERLGQGTRERDGQQRAGRLTLSLKGTWVALHRSGKQLEKVNTGHPAAAMGQS
jgi:hypothetical protein